GREIASARSRSMPWDWGLPAALWVASGPGVAGLPLAAAPDTTSYPHTTMNDPLSRFREQIPRSLDFMGREPLPDEGRAPDPVQMLTAKLLLFTGVGTALESWRSASRGRE